MPALCKSRDDLISLSASFTFHVFSCADLYDLLSPERDCNDLYDVIGEGHPLWHPQLKVVLGKKVKMDRFVRLAAQNQSGKGLPSETLVGPGFNMPFVSFLLKLCPGCRSYIKGQSRCKGREYST